MSRNDEKYWKDKLLAYLHDPPHKPYGIVGHEDTIQSNLTLFGLTKEDYVGIDKFFADSFASAADRFCFPSPQRKWKEHYCLRTDWLEEGVPFFHPFCGTKLTPHAFPVTKDVAADWMSRALNGVIENAVPSKNNFLKMWRLWEKRLIADGKGANAYFQFLVADTRIPDHTIWQHNALVAAMLSCGRKPAFLLFQLGPVQAFIAQAKTTRDLWAGSYILSYLNAKAMCRIAEEYGPDHIIFPQIKGNPIIDRMLWSEYGNELEFTDEAYRQWCAKQLLTPSLPNRFLAIIPHKDAAKVQADLESAVRATWKDIEGSVRDFMKNAFAQDDSFQKFPDWDCLWNEQVKGFPRIDCLITPFENNKDLVNEFVNSGTPPYENPEAHPTLKALKWAKDDIFNADLDHPIFDKRNYKNRYDKNSRSSTLLNENGDELATNEKPVVDNIGATWALQYMRMEWLFGGVRACRNFEQRFLLQKRGYQDAMRKVEKDHLDGVNEVLGGKKEKDFWKTVQADENLSRYFRGTQRYGAVSVIKRLFAKAYLSREDVYDFDVHGSHRIKSVYEVATGKKVETYEELTDADCKYYAVLCLDGDDIGKWISGVNAMPVKDQICGEGIKQFFNDNASDKEMLRSVTPSYHAMFSEALANFSNYCVEPIVSEFGGFVVYSGGDDVMAILPALEALECAEALQLAFRGLKPADCNSKVFTVMNKVFDYGWSETNKNRHADGFLKFRNPGSARTKALMLMPGPRATVSVGVAIGHLKSPMQDIINAARDAEHIAKEAGKDGFYLSLKKRSGESNGFFAHWNHQAENEQWKENHTESSNLYAVWNTLFNDPSLDDKSNRLPYIYAQHISPLLRDNYGKYMESFDKTTSLAALEFLAIVLERQAGLKSNEARIKAEQIIVLINLNKVSPENYLNFWMSYAFVNRMKQGGE